MPARYRHALWVVAIVLMSGAPALGSSRFYGQMCPSSFKSSEPELFKNQQVSSRHQVLRLGPKVSAPANTSSLRLDDLLQRRRQSCGDLAEFGAGARDCYALFVLYRIGVLVACVAASKATSAVGLRTRDSRALMASVAARCQCRVWPESVSLVFSTETTAPATIGRSALIILPESFYEETPEETLISVLGHEMAHIARRDFALNLAYEFLLPSHFIPSDRKTASSDRLIGRESWPATRW